MAPIDFTERCFETTDRERRSSSAARQRRIVENKETGSSTRDDKIDFFRCMGLEFSNASVLNDNNNNNNNNDDCVTNSKLYEDSYKRKIEEKNRQKNRRFEMTESARSVSHIRQCSVTIIGDKCKVCGKSFKCIKDVQLHVRRKHRRKKPRKNLVLKIGNEVISRVPIRRKHLKFLRRNDHNVIVASEEKSCNVDVYDDDEERVPFVDLDTDVDVDVAGSRFIDTATSGEILHQLESQTGGRGRQCRADDDEDIQVLLRITRPRTSGPAMEINHETPNRTEREILASDAVREYVEIDNDEPMDTNESEADDDEIGNNVTDDCYWLTDGALPYSHLDGDERNCSFHIENVDDIECMEDTDWSTKFNERSYFEDKKNCRIVNGFRRQSCIGINDMPNDGRPTHRIYNNNNMYELDGTFYEDSGINEWNNVTGVSRGINCDGQYAKTGIESSVLIKEEIMLEDLF